MTRLCKTVWTPWTASWRTAMPLLSMLAWSVLCGCQGTRVVMVAADRVVVPLPAHEAFTPAVPGWFVPEARMQELLRKLELKTP